MTKIVPFYGGPFSNFFDSPFTINGIMFLCGEQYMMYEKAKVFGDHQSAYLILKAKMPWEHKRLGRKVRNFDPDHWAAVSFDIMVTGLMEKFRQNEYCLTSLMETGDAIIVEASPTDCIWGVGLAEDDPDVMDQSKWQGENRLGNVLMKVRENLKGQWDANLLRLHDREVHLEGHD